MDGSVRFPLDAIAELLDLQALADSAVAEKEPWCHASCQRERQDYGRMILCGSTKCEVGWYHRICVGLPKRYWSDNHEWVRGECEKADRISLSDYDHNGIEAHSLKASKSKRPTYSAR